MKINFQFEAQLQKVAATVAQPCDAPEESLLTAALHGALRDTPGELRDRVLTDDSQIQSGILVFVNEQPVPTESVGTRVLREGDTVLLLPPISGG